MESRRAISTFLASCCGVQFGKHPRHYDSPAVSSYHEAKQKTRVIKDSAHKT
jgi:hypothetical protein